MTPVICRRNAGKTRELRLKPGVPFMTMCNGALTFYPKGEMRRLGRWDGDTFLHRYTSGKRPPGKKARETWGPDGRTIYSRVDFLCDNEPAHEADICIVEDKRTGIAYTHRFGTPLQPDELSPWRRGVIR